VAALGEEIQEFAADLGAGFKRRFARLGRLGAG
jgi:hypothetical protein